MCDAHLMFPVDVQRQAEILGKLYEFRVQGLGDKGLGVEQLRQHQPYQGTIKGGHRGASCSLV